MYFKEFSSCYFNISWWGFKVNICFPFYISNSKSYISMTNTIPWDYLASSCAIMIPYYSIESYVSPLSPAVSVNMTCYPYICICVLIKSLVVPGISLTIATLLFAILFISVLLPAFGGPSIDILIPSLIVSATSASRSQPSILLMSYCISIFKSTKSCGLRSLVSSASKSMKASAWANIRISYYLSSS